MIDIYNLKMFLLLQMIKDARDVGSILGLGRSPGGGNDNPLQYSCLENPVDRSAWLATTTHIAHFPKVLRVLVDHSKHAFMVMHFVSVQHGMHITLALNTIISFAA